MRLSGGKANRDLVSGNSLASPFADKGENVKDVFECSDSAQFMQAANEQKISSEVLDLVASARDEAAATPAAASIAAAPHGAITVNASAKTDMRGRQYFSLLEGPAILVRPTKKQKQCMHGGSIPRHLRVPKVSKSKTHLKRY